MNKIYCPTCKDEILGTFCSTCGTKGIATRSVDVLVAYNW